MPGWRNVRVFLSSTFRDMHAERDHLIKVTFPALRERLLPHRVELYDIDLRWGITEDEAQEREGHPPLPRTGGRVPPLLPRVPRPPLRLGAGPGFPSRHELRNTRSWLSSRASA